MSRITPKRALLSRRQLVKQAVAIGLLPAVNPILAAASTTKDALEVSSRSHVISYNNYYEFSTNKEAVAHLAKRLTLKPWTLEVHKEGELHSSLSLEDVKSFTQHKRVYRLRCVEGWSAVVPWAGIQLRDLLTAIEAQPQAKYVKFESLYRPAEMLGQRRSNFPWPYTEGLRMDEAMHPLTMLVFGMYDGELVPQCGAPLRLIVPWKYGFKSLKALTRISLTDEKPVGSWSQISPGEYGFYANVNPDVPHPRWSQRRELPLGEIRKVRTLPFNGYEDEVAHLYAGMDLEKHF